MNPPETPRPPSARACQLDFPVSVTELLKIVAENYDPHTPLTPKQKAERERLLNYKFDEENDENES